MSRIPVPTSHSYTLSDASSMNGMSPAADTRKKQSKRDEVSFGFGAFVFWTGLLSSSPGHTG